MIAKVVRIITLLLLLVGLTWLAQKVHLRVSPPSTGDAVERAERRIAAQLDAMQEAMVKRADALASDPVLLSALGPSAEVAPLIRQISRDRLPDRWSAEIYNAADTLVAWDGVSIPTDTFGSGDLCWGLAADSSWRQALELWYPVEDSSGLLGHVRLLQLLYDRAPVQNEYFQDYHIGTVWSRLTGMPVRTSFSMQRPLQDGRPIRARDDTVVGYYALVAPQKEQLIADRIRSYRDVQALWWMLIMVVGLWVCWRWYRAGRSWLRLGAFSLSWWVTRFVLLQMDVPGRWQAGKAPLNPLFDATHLASEFGEGLMRSVGDFMVSAFFLLIFSLVLVRFAFYRYGPAVGIARAWYQLLRSPAQVCRVLGAMAAGLGFVGVLGAVSRHAVLDSTVDYLARDTLLSQPVVLSILCALVVTALAVVLMIVAAVRMALDSDPRVREQRDYYSIAASLLILLGLVAVVHTNFGVLWFIALAFLGAGTLAVFWRIGASLAWFSLRGLLLATLVVRTLFYAIFFAGLSEQRHRRMEQAAASFDRGFDPSIAFAVRDLLEEIRTDTTLMTSASSTVRLTTPTLLASRGAFDLDLRIIDATAEQDTAGLGGLLLRADREGVAVDANASGQIYVGVMPVVTGNVRTGWILVHATPHVLPEEAATPLLHSLLSSGYRGLYANFSQASFRDGMLDRSVGRSFRHVALDEEVARSLQDAPDVWRFDTHGDRQYETYYLRRSENHIVGVRAAVVLLIDHLYYLLRIIVAGLIVGVPFYIVGLILRRSAGKLPAKRVRFRDKMLNAFLVMAIIVVIPVGIVGVGIITEENTKAMQSWLRNYLQLVELSLSAEAQGEEVSIDSLAARFGLDLNLYEKENLVASSRSLLVEDRLTDVRLPIQAYEALLVDGYEFVAVAQQTGNLRYTAGYHALLNEQGQPDYVLSIPTLAEQERIDEERVRTLSYLFGALLALVSLVMFTAAIMASALASPLARFQQGLKAVAQGRFEQRLQVQTRDEVGQLVSTFNDMQHQLAESRRQLTRQERQLAWREMARQVAHEIKNPLTPMKLSLQHLQRAYETRRKGDDASFSKLFRDKTSALIEEIGSLARIANEFASFARMPERIMERLDLVEVIRESASLMQTEADSGISFEVQLPEEALIVEADRQELKRIYVNLFKNALEAMREDVEGRIVATARREKGMAYSSVSDTGCGIPDELQDKIFEPSFSTKTSGTGLGLAIARHSIAVLGGTIGFEPQLSGGTLFFVRLPLVS